MSATTRQIESALAVIHVHSPTSFSWFGKTMVRLASSVTRHLSESAAQSFLHYNLQAQLYRDFYCRGFATPTIRETYGVTSRQDMVGFVRSLEEANHGHGHYEGGWKVVGHEPEAMVLEKENLRLRAKKRDCRPVGESGFSDGVKLQFPKGLRSISPGFYMALSDVPFDDTQADLRFYWNLTPAGAARLLGAATRRLNEARIPYLLKVLNDPAAYRRSDAGVLYVRSVDYPNLGLERLHDDVYKELKPSVPAFTKPLAPGLALAEDPGAGTSFGLHRCSLLADGVVRAFHEGRQSGSDSVQAVLARFLEEGLLIERPYLNRGSQNHYPFHANAVAARQQRTRRAISGGEQLTPRLLLDTADSIGRRIADQAVLHGEICNWIGAVPVDGTTGSVTLAYKSLGPDLYGGAAGVGLFLAELYAATGTAKYRDLALRAIRGALKHADLIRPHDRLSLYQGWVGIAYSAAYVGFLLDEPSMVQSALGLLERMGQLRPETHEMDLLAGSAGAVAGLVTLHRLFDREWLLDFAADLGDDLIGKAQGSIQEGYSWPSPENPRQPNLLGFSHGAAGIAYALNELFAATRMDKYRQAASLALRYEASWFQREQGNWPDFRDLTKADLRRSRVLPSAPLWCHGAPGVACSLLRASELSADQSYLEDASIALETTSTAIEGWLSSGSGNFCLCHGLAGNADILLYAARQFESQRKAELLTVVDRVLLAGHELHSASGLAWPCGTGAGETPALMLGLAGIGLFYLRRNNPLVPSVLVLEPDRVSQRLGGVTPHLSEPTLSPFKERG